MVKICPMRMPWLLAAAFLGVAATMSAGAERRMPEWSLWYRQPAAAWTEALPLGNGRLGAMLFGGIDQERLQFNEDTLWTGHPHEYQHAGAVKYLPMIRSLLAEGRQ